MPIDNVLTPIPSIDVRRFIPLKTTEEVQAVQFELRDLGGIGGNTDLFLATTAKVQEIENLGSLLAQEVIESTRNTVTPRPPTSCQGFLGEHFFSSVFRNASQNTLYNLVVEVAEITDGNLLDIPNAPPQGLLALMIVERTAAFLDGQLSPGESVIVPFGICLKVIPPQAPVFRVDIYGTK
jgi:hypothetical protein